MIRLASILGLFFVLAMPLSGQEASFGPDIPKAQGEECVADPDFMRINHMALLRHDRDDAVILGEKDVKYSLAECIACHAVQGEDSQPVSIKSEKHFCRVCHDYAAVRIDCFQCHNSKPEGEGHASTGLPEIGSALALLNMGHADSITAITDYLEEANK